MFTPNLTKIPKEATIEVMTNHFLLSSLGSPPTWMFCPTRREEFHLGYDASLQGAKVGIIQYKGVARLTQKGLSFSVNVAQHKTLLKTFPCYSQPYVFYAGATFRSYAKISQHFSSTPPENYLDYCFFINAHDVPANCQTLTYSDVDGINTIPTGTGSSIHHWNGNEFIKEFKKCCLGGFSTELPLPENAGVEGTSFGRHISVLMWNP